MRALILLAVVVTAALVAAGYWYERTTPPVVVSPAPSVAAPPPAAVEATHTPEVAANDALASSTPATATDATASTTTPASTPASEAQTAPPPATDASTTSTDSAAASETPSDAPVPDGTPKFDVPADTPQETADAAEDPNADAAAATDDAEASADDAPADPNAMDVDAAQNLIANWVAAQETAPDGDQLGAAAKRFDGEDTDADWSGASTQQIETVLDQWIAGLPDEVKSRIALLSVQCRTTTCQILAADSDAATQSQRATAGQEWQQAIATLPQQPWWSELGFVDMQSSATTQTQEGEGGSRSYVLYQTYLFREVKPAG